MAVPTTFSDLNTSPAANSPQGSEAVFPDLDNHLRAIYAMLASVQANTGNGWVSPYATKAAPIVTGGMTVTGTVAATAFSGPLSGNASTATYATTAGALTGGSSATSGAYTPVLTVTSGGSSASCGEMYWTRVGNNVTVSGQLQVTVTTQYGLCSVGVELPAASAFTLVGHCSGGGSATVADVVTTWAPISVRADTTNDRIELRVHGLLSATVHILSFTATYVVI